jgi:hypothetical protein
MALLRLLALAVGLGAASACGTGGAPAGGNDHLPTSAGGPYGAPSNDPDTPAEEPYVVVETGVDLSAPAARWRDGGFDLWFTRRPKGDPPGPASIAYARVADTTALPDAEPVVVLTAAEAWEDGEVAAPSVVEIDGRLVMYYQGGTTAPAIGRATSSDGGRTWTRDGMVLSDAVDPSALVIDGRVFLYVGRPDGSAIDVAESLDGGLSFARSPAPALAPRPGLVDGFDQVAVGAPDAASGRTVTGQLVVGLFYTGQAANGVTAIGHARSADGRMFVRFFAGEAVLDAATPAERDPAAVLFADRGVLFVTLDRGGRSAIAAALHP